MATHNEWYSPVFGIVLGQSSEEDEQPLQRKRGKLQSFVTKVHQGLSSLVPML